VIDRVHLQQLFLVLLAIGALGLCYVMVEPFIGTIVSAVAMAILFYPLHVRLRRRVGGRPNLAASLSLLLMIALVVIPAAWIVMAMSKELAGAYALLKTRSAADGGWAEWIVHAGTRMAVYFGLDPAAADEQVRGFLSERVALISGALLRAVQGVVSNVAAFLFDTVIALFVLYFLLRDGYGVVRKARELLPLPHAVFDRLIAEVGQSVLANVYGVGAVAVAQGTLTGLLFAFTGVHSPVVWGVIAGFCSMIPIVGPPVVWIPAAISFALNGAWGKAAIVAAFGAGVIGTTDNILRPWIISGQVQVHPLLVFISLLGGAQAFGFLGLLIGPATLSVTIVLLEFLREGLLERPGGEQAVRTKDSLPS
jgi:predicted PurR-regulated permease PerM